MQCEYFALEDWPTWSITIKRVAATSIGPDHHRLLRVMFDPRMTLQQQVSEQLVAKFGRQGVLHDHSAQCAPGRSAELCMPGVTYDRASKGAQAYVAFGAEMIRRIQTL